MGYYSIGFPSSSLFPLRGDLGWDNQPKKPEDGGPSTRKFLLLLFCLGILVGTAYLSDKMREHLIKKYKIENEKINGSGNSDSTHQLRK